MILKVGSRCYSQTCATQVIVVRAPAGEVGLTCGGLPMVEVEPGGSEQGLTGPADGLRGGSLLGKRYRDAAGSLELLVVKPGEGTLVADGVPLEVQQAKALPSSD